MSLTGVAALIAAVSFAVLACAGVYLAIRFTRVLADAATLVRETRSDQQALFACIVPQPRFPRPFHPDALHAREARCLDGLVHVG